MRKHMFRFLTASALATVFLMTAACGKQEQSDVTDPASGVDNADITESQAETGTAEVSFYFWEHQGDPNGDAIHLMTENGEVLTFPYRGGFPFRIYTAVGTEAKGADFSTGVRMKIVYDGDLTEIFANKQYEKIREARILEMPEEAMWQFGVIREVEDDRILVYLGRCDDVTKVSREDCVWIPMRNIPVVENVRFHLTTSGGVPEPGQYVDIYHSGTREGDTFSEVYCVKILTNVAVKQYQVSDIRPNGFWIGGMRLGFSVFEAGAVLENGTPVAAEDIRIGDTLEVEWDGTVLESAPGQFGRIYIVRVVARAE